MDSLKALKYMCKLEQFLNIHRDYIYLSRKKRIFITSCIILDIIISVLLYLDNVSLIYHLDVTSLRFYTRIVFRSFYVLLNLLTVCYLGPKYGIEFKKILKNVNRAHDIVIEHNPLFTNMRVNIWFLAFPAVLSIARAMINIYCIKDILKTGDSALIVVQLLLVLTFKMLTELRFLSSLLMCCAILSASTLILRNMNSLLKEKVAFGNTTIEKQDDYAEAYRQLLEAGKNLKKCFGDQILYSMILAITHIVCLVYEVINAGLQRIQEEPYTSSLVSYSFIFLYAGCLVIISKTGQNLNNESTILNRLLVKFLCKGLKSNEAQTTALKDFKRLVSIQPMNIHLMPNMPLGMSLLPAFLTFAINHVIVCLQLRHDI